MAALSKNPGGGKTSNAAPKDSGFNKSEIQALYLSGDFEPLISLLENLRHQRRMHDREDSAFIFKYLGVVYGADEASRKKAESFLYQMLKLNPSADLSDMGVGDNIEALFQKVRQRFETSNHDTAFARQRQIINQQWTADSLRRDSIRHALSEAQNPAPVAKTNSAAESSPAEGSGRKKMWVWVAAGGAALVATTGIIIALSGGSSGKKTDSVVTVIK